MVLIYALGGGLGHVTRARAAVHTLGFPESSASVMSPIREIGDRRIVGEMSGIRTPGDLEHDRDGLGKWVTGILDDLHPALFVVDAFPAGILGELRSMRIPSGITIIHLARRLRWRAYVPMIGRDVSRFLHPPPSRCTASHPTTDDNGTLRFDCVYRLEELESSHESYLLGISRRIEDLELIDPRTETTEREQRIIATLRDGPRPLWLVVHSGSDDEIRELVLKGCPKMVGKDRNEHPYLSRPRVVVVSPHGAPDGMEHVDIYPASRLFPIADRIITAGGFNIMRQLAPYRDRHIAIPLHRRFDDQRWRVHTC